MQEPHTLMPNTTQVPNLIIDEWMPRLKDVEFRVLMIITRQTLGWVEDKETGRRKEKDWISQSQLAAKSGKSRKHLSAALKSLIETYALVEATDAKGRILNTAAKRQAKFGQIFYRLTLRSPALTLFDPHNSMGKIIADASRASKGRTEGVGETKRRTQKGRTTKETQEQKEIHLHPAEPAAPKNEENKGENASKPATPHHELVRFFHDTTKRARGIKPIITGMDGANLKRVLDMQVSRETIEQAMIFFLYDPSFKTFSPVLSTLLSSGVLTGILNRMRNEPGFWKQLDHFAAIVYGPNPFVKLEGNAPGMRKLSDQLSTLREQLAKKMASHDSHRAAVAP